MFGDVFDDTIVNERFFVLVMPQSHRRGVLLYGSLRNLVKPQSHLSRFCLRNIYIFFFPLHFCLNPTDSMRGECYRQRRSFWLY